MEIDELNRLRTLAAAKLEMQAARARRFQAYYDNQAGIVALLDTDERQTFRAFLQEASADWCALVVNAVAERLRVVGFRFADPADSDAAWAIWQDNSMDADSELVQSDALTMSSSFVLVQPDEDRASGVSITAESPMQATVLYEPGSRRKRLAGYKRYGADADLGLLPPSLEGSCVEVLITADEIVTWYPGSTRDRPEIEPNPSGEVGLVEIVPWPRTLGWPRSELGPAMAGQDRINTTIFNRLVATDFAAFRTIWATGVKIARQVIKTETGDAVQVVKPFDIGANRLLTSEDPASRFGGIPESTLSGYLAGCEQDIQTLAATTQTPPHYLLGQMINLAADAIKAAEAGLVSKCHRRALHIGEGWEETARLALAIVGNPAATDRSAEVIWADMEIRSEGQLVDALVKMATIGVPRRVLWQRWGATPQQITEWEALLAAEGPAQIQPAPTVPSTGGVPTPQ